MTNKLMQVERRAPEVTAETIAIFKALTDIQAPCAYPLLELLSEKKGVMSVAAGKLAAAGKHEEAAKYYRDVYRGMIMIMAGYQAGGSNPILHEGHPDRCVNLMGLLAFVKKLKKASRGQDLNWVWDDASPSLFFSRLPHIPTPHTSFGMTIQKQFLEEIKIGYGDDWEETAIYKAVMKSTAAWI